MSNATYDVVEPVASDWLETRDPAQDMFPGNPSCLFAYEEAYNKSLPSRTPSLQCKCAYCGKIFLISKHHAQDIVKRNKAFCSRLCAKKFRIIKHKSYICEFCNKFVPVEKYYGNGRFCSLTCAKKFSGCHALKNHFQSQKKKIKKNKSKKCKQKSNIVFKISTIIQRFNYNNLQIDIPHDIQCDIIEGAKYIIHQMLNKWSIWDISLLLEIKNKKHFVKYCKMLKIEDNSIFLDKKYKITIKICRRILNKPLSAGSITIEERNQIGRECERLLYEEKWSTKKVCEEYLYCKKSKCAFLKALGVRTYTVSEALLIRHNISPEQRNAFKNYRRKCKFNFTKELEECLFGEDKKAIANDKPTKDHMISVIYGFIHDIDPYLMSHPANCMILSNSSNSSKNGSCSITIDELMERVEWFNSTILAKTEEYAKKYRKFTRHRLGNMFPIESMHRFKILSMIE